MDRAKLPILLLSLTFFFSFSISAARESYNEHLCTATSNIVTLKNASCESKQFFSMLLQGYVPLVNVSGLDVNNLGFLNNKNKICVYQKKTIINVEKCCTGWTGENCNRPICEPECQNGGTCIGVDKCSCLLGFVGYRCHDKLSDADLNHKFCYTGSDCSGPELSYGKVSTFEECCGKGNITGSWGIPGRNCTPCVFYAHPNRTTVYTQSHSCRSYGQYRMRTFDGSYYNFAGNCTYSLIEVQDYWQIEITFKNCDRLSTCRKSLKMIFGPTVVQAEGNNILLNGKLVDLNKGALSEGLMVTKRYDYVAIENSAPPVRILMANTTFVEVTLGTIMKGDPGIRGLCSNYNEKKEDDFLTPEKVVQKEGYIYANSYVIKETNSKCVTLPVQHGPKSYVQASEKCKQLEFHPFKKCHNKVDPTYWIDICEKASSHAFSENEALYVACTTLSSYTRECSAENTKIEWRTKDNCFKSCPAGMEYDECTSACPPTCRTINMTSSDCDFSCVPTCRCQQNLYYEDGKCVKQEECPCEYQSYKYKSGSMVKMLCNKCQCNNGAWDCETKKCPAHCSILGRNSVITFDGQPYKFEPQACAYTLIEPRNVSINLRVTLLFGPCTTIWKEALNCTTGLSIEGTGFFVTVSEKSLFVNGRENVKLPYYSNHIHVKRATSSFYLVEGKGFRILFNQNRQIYIKLNVEPFKGKVRGLCGNFDSDMTNDFNGPSGLPLSKLAFTQAYLSPACDSEQQEDVEDMPCSTHFNNKKLAKEYCQILKDKELFSKCDDIVQFHLFYEQCLRDMCTRQDNNNVESMCIALEAYARQCALNGAIVDWRKNVTLLQLCPYKCKNPHEVYMECGSSCYTSCDDRQYMDKECEEECIPGCQCPHNRYSDSNMKCVSANQCTCYDKATMKTYEAGDSVRRACGKCFCNDGRWNCKSSDCIEQVICPKNQVWHNNASGCQITCTSLARPLPCSIPSGYEGCRCPEGTVLGPAGSCILPNSCPCRYGTTWESAGSVKKIGCKQLVCINATWIDQDVKDCPATCWVSGDPHFRTFDGKHFSFQGDCAYVMAQSSKDKAFSIIIRNVKCGLTGVTCTKEVTIHLKGNVIHMMLAKTPTINDIEIPSDGYDATNVIIRKSGFFLSVFTKFGLTLQWDFGTRIYIHLTDVWRNKVEGLCGNYDGMMDNDFKSKQKSLELKPSSFAHTWRVYDCPFSDKLDSENYDPCEINAHRKPWAMETCGIIKNGPVFSKCRSVLPNIVVNNYYDDCLFDACGCDLGGDCECLCTALSNFAAECSANGFPVRWRRQELCPIQCEDEMAYLECGPANPPTCKDINVEYRISNYSSYCIEGCFCPNGYVLDGKKCILKEDCPCVYEGLTYPHGSMVLKKPCMNCTCNMGQVKCVNVTCRECTVNEFECQPGECINITSKCDGSIDCIEGTDETNCPTQIFSSTEVTSLPTIKRGETTSSVFACEVSEGMNKETLIPDSSIELSTGEDSSVIRPGKESWIVRTKDRQKLPFVTINVKNFISSGIMLKLLKHNNVAQFRVTQLQGSNQHSTKIYSASTLSVIPPGSDATHIKIEFVPENDQIMQITLSIKSCFQNTGIPTGVYTHLVSPVSSGTSRTSVTEMRTTLPETLKTLLPETLTTFPGISTEEFTPYETEITKELTLIPVLTSIGSQTTGVETFTEEGYTTYFPKVPSTVYIPSESHVPSGVALTKEVTFIPDKQYGITTAIAAEGMTCQIVDGMNSTIYIPDSNIIMPDGSAPKHIRPGGNGWRTKAEQPMPTVSINVGKVFDMGVEIKIPKHDNVKTFFVIYWEGHKKIFKKFNGDSVAHIQTTTKTDTLEFSFDPIDSALPMKITISITACFIPIGNIKIPHVTSSPEILPLQTSPISESTLEGFPCKAVDGMASPFFIPVENIKLLPVGSPDLLRPTKDGWRILTIDNPPLVNITLGNDIKQGLSIKMVKHINVLDYYIIYWEGPTKNMKLFKAEEVAIIPPGSQASALSLIFQPVRKNKEMVISLSIKGCFTRKFPVTLYPEITTHQFQVKQQNEPQFYQQKQYEQV